MNETEYVKEERIKKSAPSVIAELRCITQYTVKNISVDWTRVNGLTSTTALISLTRRSHKRRVNILLK